MQSEILVMVIFVPFFSFFSMHSLLTEKSGQHGVLIASRQPNVKCTR